MGQVRWGIWNGILSVVDAVLAPAVQRSVDGTRFGVVPWHPAIYQEAGLYNATVTLPAQMQVASYARR